MSLLATTDDELESILSQESADSTKFELDPKSVLSMSGCRSLVGSCRLTGIETLTLRDCALKSEMVELLVEGLEAQPIRLLHLTLAQNKEIGPQGAASVSRLLLLENGTIQTLDLSDTQCRDEGCEALALALKKNVSLQKLDLGGQYPANYLTKRGMKALGDAFMTGIPLKELSVFGNKIGDDGCVALVEKLAVTSHSLTSLNLCWNNLGVGAGNAIGIMLSTTKSDTLRILNLETNPLHDAACKSMGLLMSMRSTPLALGTFMVTWAEITEDGAQGLEQLFAKCNGLKHVDVSYNNLGDVGIARLVCGISAYSIHTIQHLNLNSEQLTARGAAAVADLAGKSTSLKFLNLSNNKIGDTGCCELVGAFLKNEHTVLENLRFYGCEITEKGAAEVARLLRKSCTLKTIQLSKNHICDGGALVLFRALSLGWQEGNGDECNSNISNSSSAPSHSLKELGLVDSEVSAHALDLVNSALCSPMNVKVSLHHAAQLGALNVCKELVPHMDSLEEAINICQTGSKAVRKCALSIQAFLGRYRLESGPAVHRSATCVVHFAVDLEEDDHPVAIKHMRESDQFEREIRGRAGICNKVQDSPLIISIRGWHVPEGMTLNDGGKWQELEHTKPGDTYPFVVVMERGGRSLFASLVSERFAGFEVNLVRELFSSALRALMALQSSGVVHGDVKPRNFLRTGEQGGIQLCDLDVALAIGSTRSPEVFKISSAYAAPELLASSLYGFPVEVGPALDVWGLGVVLFELCTGRQLFVQDLSDDSLARRSEINRLLLWVDVTDSDLDDVFKNAGSDHCSNGKDNGATMRAAKDLIRRCLRGDAKERPSLQQICEHPFVSGAEMLDSFSPPRYHMFISHAQSEAAGSVGTLHHHFAQQMSFNVWRDVEQADLTEHGMELGVHDSDIFILFLTASTLSRSYCIKEVTWALKMKKPIVIVTERDARFMPFDLARWQKSMLTRDPVTWEWVKSNDLQVPYEDCPMEVRELVEGAFKEKHFVIYRRRWFEVTPMIYSIVEEAARVGCTWADRVPPDPSDLIGSLSKKATDQPGGTHTVVRVISQDHSYVKQIMQSLETNPPGLVECHWDSEAHGCVAEWNAGPTLVVLSKGLLELETKTLKQLVDCLESSDDRVIFVYLPVEDVGDDIGWKFYSAEHRNSPQIVRQALTDHEGITYRSGTLETSHEHRAMVNEILRRLGRQGSSNVLKGDSSLNISTGRIRGADAPAAKA